MKKGFTLLEILIVISIISVLVLVFLISSNGYVTRADLQRQKTNSMVLESAIRQHKLEGNELPLGDKITKEITPESRQIIEQQLKSKGVKFDDIKDSFYELDKNKIKMYIKGQMKDLDRYFSSDSKVLEGMVFTYDTISVKKDGIYSGSYVLLETEETGGNEVKPPETTEPPITTGCNVNWSSDSTIRLPQQGSGTPEDPYLIRTIGEVQGIKLDLEASFKLGNNIEGCVTKEWNNGEGFEPIQDFDGTMEKSDYSIDNLYINRPNEDYVGLFANVHVTLDENFSIQLKNPTVLGKNYVGAISGHQRSYKIFDISVENGNITGQNHVGLFFGYSEDEMARFFGTGTVKGKYYVGGITGSGLFSRMRYGYFRGTVEGDTYVGGLSGYDDDSPFLDQVYVSSTIQGKKAQPFFGFIKGLTPYVRSYYNTDKISFTSNVGEGYTEEQLKKRDTYNSWDKFDTYFNIHPSINDGFPYLK
ncbi:prepilin-type N-terminal cleavage/methylation domain-containing protein [Bacillus paranthracis]|uniref:prepilin-type N-terminal cleavage/methylation domain-containing protein n=1 Tax=Bacillus paranthracis TaxID=2026186 RepID=UPI0001A10800|nr:hypothetical protein bcere0029_59940 [Bacillus cereus AH1272]EEL90196.1 hypothetical protein bcere0030_58710 [Bacillus cereus AH1273]